MFARTGRTDYTKHSRHGEITRLLETKLDPSRVQNNYCYSSERRWRPTSTTSSSHATAGWRQARSARPLVADSNVVQLYMAALNYRHATLARRRRSGQARRASAPRRRASAPRCLPRSGSRRSRRLLVFRNLRGTLSTPVSGRSRRCGQSYGFKPLAGRTRRRRHSIHEAGLWKASGLRKGKRRERRKRLLESTVATR